DASAQPPKVRRQKSDAARSEDKSGKEKRGIGPNLHGGMGIPGRSSPGALVARLGRDGSIETGAKFFRPDAGRLMPGSGPENRNFPRHYVIRIKQALPPTSRAWQSTHFCHKDKYSRKIRA